MTKHTWTYAEITEQAEARIKCLMALAAKKRSEQETSSASSIEDYAYGVHCLWTALTYNSAAQEPGDAQRLEALMTRHVPNHG